MKLAAFFFFVKCLVPRPYLISCHVLIAVCNARAFDDVRTYQTPALCLGTPVPRQKILGDLHGGGGAPGTENLLLMHSTIYI